MSENGNSQVDYPRLRNATRYYFQLRKLTTGAKNRSNNDAVNFELDSVIVSFIEAQKFSAGVRGGMKTLVEYVNDQIRDAASEELPANIYEWLQDYYGFPRLHVCRLLAETGDLRKFRGPRSLRHYCGLHVIDGHEAKMRKGQKGTWDPRLKGLLLSPESNGLATQLIKLQGGIEPFRTYYDEKKAYLQGRPPTEEKHTKAWWIHLTARRFMINQFLNMLWEQYQKLDQDVQIVNQ